MSIEETQRKIRNIQENIAKATNLIDEFKETLDQLNQDLSGLTLQIPVTRRQKKKKYTPSKTSDKRT